MPSPFELSGTGAVLLSAERRCISGVVCRLLTYAIGLPKESGLSETIKEEEKSAGGRDEGREQDGDNMSVVTWDGQEGHGDEHYHGNSVDEGVRGQGGKRAARGREEESGDGYEVFKHEAPGGASNCRQAMEFAYQEEEETELEVAYVAVLLNPQASLIAASDFSASGSASGDLKTELGPADVRAHLRLPLTPLLESMRVRREDLIKDRPACKEVLRTLAGYLRFSYDGPEGKPSLILPYTDMRARCRRAVRQDAWKG